MAGAPKPASNALCVPYLAISGAPYTAASPSAGAIFATPPSTAPKPAGTAKKRGAPKCASDRGAPKAALSFREGSGDAADVEEADVIITFITKENHAAPPLRSGDIGSAT